MPLFVFVTGYLSKHISHQRRKELYMVLFTYVMFEVINFIYTKSTPYNLGVGSLNIFEPSYQNWYLLALFFWRTFTPYYKYISPRNAITLSIIIAFIIGFFPSFSSFLALYRSIYLMPFFLMGFFYKDINLTVSKLMNFKIVFIFLLVLLLTCIYILSLNEYADAIFYAYTPRFGYGGLNFNNFILRIIGFTTSTIIAFLFLFVVPQKKNKFTKYGKNTLSVYLLHQFFIWPICRLLFKLNINDYIILIGGFFYSLFLLFLLASERINVLLMNVTSFDKFKEVLRIRQT